MMKQYGPWKILSTREIYKNSFGLEVREDQVIRPDGKSGIFGVVTLSPGVAILPFDDEGFIYLVEQFRYALGEDSLEAASGGIDANEDPLEGAKRELAEELGISAKEWISLGFINTLTSNIGHKSYSFLAKDLSFGEPTPDGTEVLKTVRMPFKEAFSMVMEGKIVHSPTCVLIFKANEYLKNH